MKTQVDINFEVAHKIFPAFSKGLVIGVKNEKDHELTTEWLVKWYGNDQGTTWHEAMYLEAVKTEDGALRMIDANRCSNCDHTPHLFGYPVNKKYRITCPKCGLCGAYGITEQEAIKRWNDIYTNRFNASEI